MRADNNEIKHTIVTQSNVLSDAWGLEIKFVENYLVLENYQQLSIIRYHVSFFANNYFK